MLKRIFLSLFLFLKCIFLFADTKETVVCGKNAEYANSEIEIYSFDDLITKKLVLIASGIVDSTGGFAINVPLENTRFVQVPLGYYNGLMYLEPGKKYEIVLPEKRDKTIADILNPYFQGVEIYLGVRNADAHELNNRIREFESIYERYVEESYYSIFKNPNESDVDTVIGNIERLFDTIPNTYFSNYREYKYTWLRYVSYMRSNLYITKDYFNSKPILYQNVAYMDLFNQLYSNYLSFYMNTSEGERIYSDIALAKSPNLVKQTMANNLVLLQDSIQEFVLLKGLFDAFYLKDFPHASMLITLDSIANHSSIKEHKKIAKNIREKVLLAKAGYPAYKFKLENSKGELVTLDSYSGKHVYLNFCTVESFPCRQDFELLKELHNKHGKEFQIVSICIDDDFQKAKEFFKSSGYEWELLSYNDNHKLLENYKVRAYPAYYLIAPDGNLQMSPAVSPGENFRDRFFMYIREAKIRDLRNNPE